MKDLGSVDDSYPGSFNVVEFTSLIRSVLLLSDTGMRVGDAFEDVRRRSSLVANTNLQALTDAHFVPCPASNMMYWVSSSEAESETGRESSAIVGSVSLEVDQGFDHWLVSLGFQCVAQQDDSESIFENPVTLKYHQQNVTYAFANLLHALHIRFILILALLLPIPLIFLEAFKHARHLTTYNSKHSAVTGRAIS